MTTMTVQSATMRRLRRELQSCQRRAATRLSPTGGVAKEKPSSPPRFSAPTSSPPAPAGRSDGVDDTRQDTARRPRSSASRTPGGTAPAERGLVKNDSLGAVVVSAADEGEGYLYVVYSNANFPRDDPFGTVRVPRSDIRNMLQPAAGGGTDASVGSSSVTTYGSASADRDLSQGKTGRQRPTVAGKKLTLLTKLEKEMQSSSKAIVACW